MGTDRESSDESDRMLAQMIHAATIQPPPEEIRRRVIERAAAFASDVVATPRRRRRRSWLLASSAVAALGAACWMFILWFPSASVGWEDVTKAAQSQPWIRATRLWNGKQDAVWLSPQRQLWAFRSNDWFIFCDGGRLAKYEFRSGDKQIAQTSLGEEDARLVAPVDYLSQGLWLFPAEKVVSQERREVTEGGKKWIEFELVFRRGEMNHATLRVDPETRLPVSLRLRSPKDPTKSMRYDFDYPQDGPADIYALGVPAGTRIESRMLPKDMQRVLDAIAASRTRLGDFRLLAVGVSPGMSSYLVWRKGDRWRIDRCLPEQYLGAARRRTPLPDGQGWGDPIAEQSELAWLGPVYICDGRTVYRNPVPPMPSGVLRSGTPAANDQAGATPPTAAVSDDAPPAKPTESGSTTWQRAPRIAPRDLLSGEGLGYMDGVAYAKLVSLAYPDLSANPGFVFEFDPQPADAPCCVVIKRSAQSTLGGTAHEWYYIDPAKGHAVVRVELFNLPTGTLADPKAAVARQTVRLEEFARSPRGFWYPQMIHDTTPLMAAPNQKDGARVHYNTRDTHYHFDFETPVPDSLFIVHEAGEVKKP